MRLDGHIGGEWLLRVSASPLIPMPKSTAWQCRYTVSKSSSRNSHALSTRMTEAGSSKLAAPGIKRDAVGQTHLHSRHTANAWAKCPYKHAVAQCSTGGPGASSNCVIAVDVAITPQKMKKVTE